MADKGCISSTDIKVCVCYASKQVREYRINASGSKTVQISSISILAVSEYHIYIATAALTHDMGGYF